MAYEKRVREALEEIVHSEVTVKQMKDHLKAKQVQPPSKNQLIIIATDIVREMGESVGAASPVDEDGKDGEDGEDSEDSEAEAVDAAARDEGDCLLPRPARPPRWAASSAPSATPPAERG